MVNPEVVDLESEEESDGVTAAEAECYGDYVDEELWQRFERGEIGEAELLNNNNNSKNGISSKISAAGSSSAAAGTNQVTSKVDDNAECVTQLHKRDAGHVQAGRVPVPIHETPELSPLLLESIIEDHAEPLFDLHSLFLFYNHSFFESKLNSVEVKWSSRMTLCAGVCVYQSGGYCSIRLSEPLLKFRNTNECKETLLHEMIHAFLFVTQCNRDHNAHGPTFQLNMKRINQLTGLNITIYHNFTDEVDHYRTHIWKCDGPCQHRPPYFGLVKRAMNRQPGPSDWWWEGHRANCGGVYVKVSAPDKPITAAAAGQKAVKGNKDKTTTKVQKRRVTNKNKEASKQAQPLSSTSSSSSSSRQPTLKEVLSSKQSQQPRP